MQITWYALLVFSAIAYVLLAVFLLPSIFFSASYELDATKDRGLKKYKQTNGRSVLFEPSFSYKKYISKYIISQNEGKKLLVAMPQKGVYYIDFDVVLFDIYNKSFKVLNIKENMTGKQLTDKLELPDETAYATLIVNYANDTKINRYIKEKKPTRKALAYAATNSLVIFAELFVVRLCVAKLFADVFDVDFLRSLMHIAITIGIGIVVSLISFLMAILRLRKQKAVTQ